MKIINEKAVIRDADETDAKILALWWNDGRVMAHAGYPNGISTNEQIVKKEIKGANKSRLILEFDNEPIGEMCYMDKGDNVVEIGIKICNLSYQNKGLGKVFLIMLMQYLFKVGFKKIKLSTMLNNKRAQHVYEQLGFKKVSINYNCWKDQLGILQSSIDYELGEDDFIELNNLIQISIYS